MRNRNSYIGFFKGKVLLSQEPFMGDHYYFGKKEEYIPSEINKITETITIIPASTSIPITYNYVIIN